MKNGRLGMVRELQDKLYGGRYAATLLDVNFDLLKIAEAYGIPAKMVHSNEEAQAEARRLLDRPGPALLLCDVSPLNPSI